MRERQWAARDELAPDLPGRSGELVIYERVLPAVPLTVRRVRTELDEALSHLRVRPPRRADIALVVSEAVSNAVLHAYVGAPPGPLVVSATVADRDLSLDVCDAGRGLLPRADSPGLGCGLLLMRRCSDALAVGPASADAGTRVSALFCRAVPLIGAPRASDQVRRTAAARADVIALGEYAEALSAASARLQDDARALMAEARQALTRAQQLRAERTRAQVGG